MWIVEEVDGRDTLGQDVNDADGDQLAVQPVLLVKRAVARAGTVVTMLFLREKYL